jgi:glycosyltransferase involved in cell wall biosynthesis
MGEDSFIAPELPYLLDEFARVFVVPAARGGLRLETPEGIEVDESLATALAVRPGRLRTLRNALAFRPLREEIGRRLDVVRSMSALRRLVAFSATATRVAQWQRTFAESHRLDPRTTVLYTYWLGAPLAGLVLAAAREPRFLVVSRGHRVDVYECDQRPPYLPCRPWLMTHLDRVFLVSEHARAYLSSRHPDSTGRLAISRLGTQEPGFRASPSADGVLRLVSCSAFLPVKQVEVLARGLVLAARAHPQHPIEWHHFGDGPLRRTVEERMRQSAPPSLSWTFGGHVSNREVYERYRSRAVDLFANTSLIEGIPVAIMEAQSCGVPAMAPAVGGVPEAVTAANGFLLAAPATPEAVAATVESILHSPALLAVRREPSRRSWEERFDATRNFAAFARELSLLRHEFGGRPRGTGS